MRGVSQGLGNEKVKRGVGLNLAIYSVLHAATVYHTFAIVFRINERGGIFERYLLNYVHVISLFLMFFVDMSRFANKIISGKGEGVMMRKPFSLYESGKSTNLLKLKVKKNHQLTFFESAIAKNLYAREFAGGRLKF